MLYPFRNKQQSACHLVSWYCVLSHSLICLISTTQGSIPVVNCSTVATNCCVLQSVLQDTWNDDPIAAIYRVSGLNSCMHFNCMRGTFIKIWFWRQWKCRACDKLSHLSWKWKSKDTKGPEILCSSLTFAYTRACSTVNAYSSIEGKYRCLIP